MQQTMMTELAWCWSSNLPRLLSNQMPAADAVDAAVSWVMSILLWVIAVLLLLALIGTLLLLVAVAIQLLRALSMDINKRLGLGQSDPVAVVIVWFRSVVQWFRKPKDDPRSSDSRPHHHRHRT